MASADDTLVAYAAGYLEAALTQELMWNHYNNFMIDSFNTTSGPLVGESGDGSCCARHDRITHPGAVQTRQASS